MLIYDHNKKFIGINEGLLQTLGFASLDELSNASKDFADLFVKKPGYIHNFQNFQWIDFILHSESDKAKVIVQAKGKGYEAEIVVKPFYLTSDPHNAAYIITLEHIKGIGVLDESAAAAAAAATPPVAPPVMPASKPAPVPEPPKAVAKEMFTPPAPVAEPTPEPVATPAPQERMTMDMPEMDIAFDTLPEPEAETDFPDFSKPLEIEEDLFMPSEASSEAEPVAVPEKESVPAPAAAAPAAQGTYFTPEEEEILANLKTPGDYVYDPKVASNELGLPVDLIEEFIGDFIGQAHEFHDELFNAARTSDFENVQILSHKLKGVAANLRVEDALEVLTNVNVSKDVVEIEANLKQFYKVIAKLEGKELPGTTSPTVNPSVPTAGVLPVDDSFDLNAPEPELKEEEDLYDFGLPPMDEEEEAAPAAKAEEPEEEEDLYDFGLPPMDEEEEAAPAAKAEEPAEEEDLYDFGLPPMDEEEETAPAAKAEEPAEEKAQSAAFTLNYDAAKAANELGIDEELVRELVNDFIDQANEIHDEFNTAIENGQHAKWQNSALQLKGITDNLRMHEISAELSALIETQESETARQAVKQFYSQLNALHS